jgi:hypothetical protein
MSKHKDHEDLKSFKMPAITIDGKRLWFCEMRAGSKKNKSAYLDLQPAILSLWNTYTSETASQRKKDEAKEGLLYYDNFLKIHIDGPSETNDTIPLTQDQKLQIYAERNARDRDLLNHYDKKMVSLDDSQHQNLSSYDGESIYDAKERIQGIKVVKADPEE